MEKTEAGLNLREFKFPDVTKVDAVFSTFDTIPELLDEAKRRGFYSGYGPYNKLASTLFYEGGRVKFKEGIPEDFRKAAWAYVRAFMGSFAPKHEHKSAICALILSEICEPELQAAE